jgi:hypothetical protein
MQGVGDDLIMLDGDVAWRRTPNGDYVDLLLPNYTGTATELWAGGTDDIWVVGTDGMAPTDHPVVHWYDGMQWFQIPITDNDGAFAVWGDGLGTVYVVSRYVHRWNGGAFVNANVPVDTTFVDVWGTSATDVWVLGNNSNLWRWDGIIWTQSVLPTNATNIAGWATDDVWISSGTGVFHWDGLGWTDTNLGQGAAELLVRGPNDVLVDVNTSNTLAHWDGFGWTTQTLRASPVCWGIAGGVTYYGGGTGVLYQPGQ